MSDCTYEQITINPPARTFTAKANGKYLTNGYDEIVVAVAGGGGGGATSAEDVIYDNTQSGLTGDNAQEAIDEIASDVEAVETEIGTTALPTTAQTLTGAIAEHEADISTLNGNLTPTSEETLVNGITYQKQAGIVFVRFNIAATIGTSFTTIGTLPTGYRPPYNVYFRIAGGNGVGDVTVLIATLGNIQAKVDTGSVTALNGLVSFITYG